MITPMTIRHDPEQREVQSLRALVPTFAGARVCEVGCGDGRLTRRYLHEARSVLAIDPDEAAIAKFRSDLPAGALDVRAIGFERLPASDGPFDAIIFSWCL